MNFVLKEEDGAESVYCTVPVAVEPVVTPTCPLGTLLWDSEKPGRLCSMSAPKPLLVTLTSLETGNVL